jgi:tRNA 2-selenouridine synthase
MIDKVTEMRPTDREIESLLVSGAPLMDVRAPVEFSHGAIPGATNLPLLNDDERAAVGTMYKRQGQAAAIKLGHQFLSGETRRARIEAWKNFFTANPSAWVYCFRGGLRSQSVQAALREEGVDIPLVEGGYKRVRQLLMDATARASAAESFAVISGLTGCGKTDLLRDLAREGARVCDLEAAANHRGSSFGKLPVPQPSQIDFENRVALELLRQQPDHRTAPALGPILLEDESRKVGRVEIPGALFDRLSTSPVYLIESSLEDRAAYLTELYISENYGLAQGERPTDNEYTRAKFVRFRQDMVANLDGISRRLGGADHQTFMELTALALDEHEATGAFDAHHEWVRRLLLRYYDPMYAYHLAKIEDRVVFRGSIEDVREKLARR